MKLNCAAPSSRNEKHLIQLQHGQKCCKHGLHLTESVRILMRCGRVALYSQASCTTPSGDEPARLSGGEGFVKRGGLVRVEIVLHQHDFRRAGKMHVWPRGVVLPRGRVCRAGPERLQSADQGMKVGAVNPPKGRRPPSPYGPVTQQIGPAQPDHGSLFRGSEPGPPLFFTAFAGLRR
jgi:hypothetical protein